MMPAPARKIATTTNPATGTTIASPQPSRPGTAVLPASTSDNIAPSAPGGTHQRGLSIHDAAADSPAESNASPDDSGGLAPEDQRIKKRKGGPGSRGVANLTPEQLAKKRANGM